MNEAMLVWSVLFSGIGIGFFTYGRKQKSAIPLLTGVALMAYPYFMPNTSIMLIVGVVLLAIPYFIRL